MDRATELLRAVDHALVAQGLLIWARLTPEAESGLLRAADHHRAEAARVVDGLQARSFGVAKGVQATKVSP